MALSLELTDTCRFLKRFPVCFNLLAFLFLVIPCILVAGVIPSKKKSYALQRDAKYSLEELHFISTVCQPFKIFVLQNTLL